MKTSVRLISAAAAIAALALAGCSSSHGSPGVPDLHSSGAAPRSSQGGYSTGRVAALHAAAQCIRTHGVPTYQDPVLTAEGQVYTDARSIQDLGAAGKPSANNGGGGGGSVLDSIRAACGTLLTTAGFQPDDVAPAPSQLVQAGVKAAQCLRANGLPNYRDPTSSTPFTPGHGFSISSDEMPNSGAGGKLDPTFQQATTACRSELDAEITASELTNLAHD